MYQYTTTNVINSLYALDYEGNRLIDSAGSDILKYTATAAGLNVVKVNYFKTANIVSVHKRPYSVGVKEVWKITVPTITSGLTVRLEVVIKLADSVTQSEYVNYSLDFKKPITVEVISSGTAATDATALAAAFNGLKNRFGQSYAVATLNGAQIILTAKEDFHRFDTVKVWEENTSSNSLIMPEYTSVGTSSAVYTSGKIGFGNDAWMARHIMLPTAENVRFFGISKDERPVLSGNYSEYVIRYSFVKENDGILAGKSSITNHVFYVKSDLVASFEAAIITTTKPIISVSTDQAFTLTLTNDDTPSVVVNITDIVPFITGASEITSSSTDTDVAEIDTTTIGAPSTSQSGTITLLNNTPGTATISVTIDGVTQSIEVTMTDLAAVPTGNGTLSTGADATDQIVTTHNAGAVTYTTASTTMIAVGASTGLVTTAGKTATGTATVTVTDAAGNTVDVEYTIAA